MCLVVATPFEYLGGIVGWRFPVQVVYIRRIRSPLAIGPTSEAFASAVVRPREQTSATTSIQATVVLETIAVLLSPIYTYTGKIYESQKKKTLKKHFNNISSP